MKKDKHHNNVVPITFTTLKHKFLYWLVTLFIEHNLFQNRNKFKEGDIVKYSWRAKVYILAAIEVDIQMKITKIEKHPDGSQTAYYLTQDGIENSCDIFWIRKIHWWEKKKVFKPLYTK